MFVLLLFCIILTVSVDASKLNLRVVEIDSRVEFIIGNSIEICTIDGVHECSFELPKKRSAFLRVISPNGHQFETWISSLRGSSATLFIHLLRNRHHFITDNSVKVGDVINTRSLSGSVIPQTTGKRRMKVLF